LWIGSDPFRTVLLFDWLGSNVVIEGAGANSSCDCKSSIATPFTTRAIRASGDCLWSHLRARSLLLRPETVHGWEANIPTQSKTKNPLKVKKLIMSIAMDNLEGEKIKAFSVWSKEEKVLVCLKLLCLCLLFLVAHSCNKNNAAVYLSSVGFGSLKAKGIRSLEHVGKF